MKNFLKNTFIFSGLLIPTVSFAATFRGFATSIVKLISSAVIPLLFSGALAYFLWGVAEFIRSAENSDARQKGKKRILWGLIALFAMVGYLGLTAVLTRTFFGGSPFLPELFTQ